MIASAGRVARALLLPAGLFLACGILVPGVPLAQSTTSTLEGIVRTPDGTPIPGAVVEARSTATGAVRGAVSDREGHFRIDLLQPGTWEVRARFSDGPAGEPVSVTLFLQQTASVDLVAGTSFTESVTVRAEADRLDPERVGGEVRFTQDQVDDLPIRGRVVTDLALLDASIKMTPPGDFFGENGAVFVVNGQSGRANSFLVDGLDNNDPISNTTLDAFFSQQVIKEFVVLTSQYAPEFGRASGGILNIITQQGTNTPSGQVFVQAVPGGLGSEGEFVGSLPADDGEQQTSQAFEGGFRFGGPIRTNRAFYFVSYEHDGGDGIVPFTGVGRDGVAGGIVVAPQRSDNLFLRSDFNLGDANFLMVRLSGGTRRGTELNVGGNTTPENGFALEEGNAQIAASLTTVLSPTLLNEVRVLAATSTFDQEANSSRPGVERPSGLFGGNNLNQQERDENRYQIVDDVSWQVNRHALKFGLDVTRSHTRVMTAFNPNGNFLYETDLRFEPGDGGDLTVSDVAMYGDNPIPNPGIVGVDDDLDELFDEDGLIKTYPIVFQLIEGTPSAIVDDTRVALFTQDTWEAGSRFVLNYGLRYDLSTFHLPAETRVVCSIPNGGAEPDRNNISPRIGFTWKPRGDNSLLVRGGAGMFYDKLVLGFPSVAAITSGTNIGLIFPQGLTLEITEDVVEQVGIDAIKEGLIFPPELVLRFSTGTTLDTPYTNQFSLGMEAEAGAHAAVRGRVTRALGYHQTLMRDLNPVVSSTAAGFPIHRDQTVGSIAAIVSEGRSWYTGLDLGWRYRSGRRWIDVSYSLSKALDLGPDPLKGGISIPPDSDDLAGEKARSDSDQRHRFVVSGALPLPWGGVWASGQGQIASGAPFNVTTGKDENLDGLTNDRPAGVQRNTGAHTPLDPVNALRATEGLAPVDSLREPVFWQMDVRIWKPFTFNDQRGKGDAFLQVFNLFDRFNPGPIEGRATSGAFGEPNGQVGSPRTIEVGFRLGF